MRFLANENFPLDAVVALRTAGHDVVWIRTESPGISDIDVLARAQLELRVLLTFVKDFGELAYRSNLPATSGVVLFRIATPSSDEVARKVLIAIAMNPELKGVFTVVEEHRIRTRPLPQSL